ncbi:uncharacterized protein LOC128656795 [Bombina bombina]|uniref:uncharacterized protein LOC128656795 n=1 Tax=Bombina bombina TaxID=8345 RepID=UPI00235A7B0C|nr:uncharacterized protein LOC128656795 [Bombina bombina]
MDPSTSHTADGISPFNVKEETKHVLEAFLKRSLSKEDGKYVGHVGRSYHDPKKYRYRSIQEDSNKSPKKTRKPDKKKSRETGKEKEERSQSPPFGESTRETNGNWNSIHEEINRVEESKHGFKTNIKRPLRKHSQTKEKAAHPKDSTGSTHSKSRDSIENVLEDPYKASSKGDSMKRPKPNLPLLACTTAGSVESLAHDEQSRRDLVDKHSSQGTQKKSKGFSLKSLLRKKSMKAQGLEPPSPERPKFLPLQNSFEMKSGKDDESEIYNLAAKKLEKWVKQKKLKSPVASVQHPAFPSPVNVKPHVIENNNVAASESASEDKEEVIKKLVVLLQEQAVVINEKISRDPFLRNALTRMSYGSFSRLVEVFTNQAEVSAEEDGASVSSELTKIALTMELTRKVAGINTYPVQTLMGYSMQYMDMFVPWLQEQGGWENIVSHTDIPDLQID